MKGEDQSSPQTGRKQRGRQDPPQPVMLSTLGTGREKETRPASPGLRASLPSRLTQHLLFLTLSDSDLLAVGGISHRIRVGQKKYSFLIGEVLEV